MSNHPNNLVRFWEELKRRKVTRVITVYAAAAFVILELVSIIVEPLKLPEWTLPMVIILLCIGFVITVIFSWIYDIHPEGGIVKTEPAHKVKPENISKSSNSWKIASYISFVVILALIVINLLPRGSKPVADPDLERSIAILPVINFLGDPGQEYICDGLTDEIIGNLYRIGSFAKVASLTSVMNYKESDLDTPEIAQKLGVNYILESTYKRIGDQLRITVQLIEPVNDNHLWLHDFDRPYKEVMSIPGDIAIQIAEHLDAFMTEDEKSSVADLPTTSLEAYELIQLTMDYARRGDLTISFLDSILKAIALDPGYADAYADLGFFILMKESFSPPKGTEKYLIWDALTYLDKALELDPDNILANVFLGLANSWLKWDYIAEEEQYVSTLENITSTNETLNRTYTEFLLKMDRLEDALSFALESETTGTNVAKIYIKEGLDHEAVTQLSETAKVLGVLRFPYIAETYIWMQKYDTARYFLESANTNELPVMAIPRFRSCLALAYRNTGDTLHAREIIGQLKAQSETLAPGSPDYFLGWYYSAIGEADSAFHYLERAFRNHSAEMTWLKADPIWENIKHDDRYWDLYERTGHKAYDDYRVSLSN